MLSKDVNTKSWKFDSYVLFCESVGFGGLKLLGRQDDEADKITADTASSISASTSTRLQSIAEDEENDVLSHGMNLLLVARNRILTISEQRVSG